MVDGHDHVAEQHRHVGQAHVARAGRRQALEMPSELVAENAHRAALERRQVRLGAAREAVQLGAQRLEGVAGRGRPSTVVRPPRLSSTWNGSTAMNEWRPASSGVAPSRSTAWGSSANGAKSAAGSA